jgi:oligosaccharide repeat unit polymerase
LVPNVDAAGAHANAQQPEAISSAFKRTLLSSCQLVEKPHGNWNTDRPDELVAVHPWLVLMLIIVLILLSILTLLNYFTCRDVGYPPFLMSAMWLLVMMLYYLAPIPIYAISFVTGLIFVVTVISFSAGGLLAFHSGIGSKDNARGNESWNERPVHPRLKMLFLLATAAALPFAFYHAGELMLQSGVDDPFIGLRMELGSEDTVGYGVVLNNIGLLSEFTTLVYAIEPRRNRSERICYGISLLVSLIYALLSTGRLAFYMLFIALTGIALIRRRLTVTKVVAGLLFLVLLFGGFAVQLRKGGDPDAPWSDNIASVTESFFTYCLGGIAAFDQVVRGRAPQLSVGAFAGIINVFYHLKGHRLISGVHPTVAVPFETNVYTALQPVYKDFGILGVVAAFALIGAATSGFYVKAKRGNRLCTLYYAVALFPLVIMVFADQYFIALSVWFRWFLAGYLYFCTGERFSLEFPAPTGIRHELS